MSKVFVYGTLRTGASNAFRMRGAKSLGPATIEASLYRVHQEFPGIVLSEQASDKVIGEVFSDVSPELLNSLDVYEGCDEAMPLEERIYQRVKTQAILELGEKVEVFVWEYVRSVFPDGKITSGDWLL